ncbi:formimidoylglutamate deiminase [Nocardioides mangrovicus]|uniref:Formimidoylglutamate deiminase n=1 Tax=Nocardioides mangrovicus TaxID=2478913 RepID=A0A3L8NX88_9ACTN|nr:formimidoylglutamate deiminase [Nocardioides mangrovicus]RLV47876.1 formimidoylglutamate deiminase [Nocardioides mangrovicus]
MSAPAGTTLVLERAFVGGAVRDHVLVEMADGRFTRVETETGTIPIPAQTDVGTIPIPAGAHPGTILVPGLTIPGLANCHSHAFHRALRGRTERGSGSFWTWRDQMYAVAERLDPDTYLALARATYREMVATGITGVGEFHYLHHQPDGTPYADPNAMGEALVAAAQEAGLRIALLDTCYLSAGFGQSPEGVQWRYSDGDAGAWAERVARLTGADDVVVGAAIHSVRAVPRDQLATVASLDGPLHVHLSEQVKENEDCLAAYGVTPTALLDESGALTARTSVVHATHLTDDDVRRLGDARSYACFCPTTERDLGDGIGPSRALHAAGAGLTLGSDSHAVIDLFEEMRAVELDERLATRRRGHWTPEELLEAATAGGHASLGFPDAGSIEVGQRADLVTVALDSVRTAGTGAGPETVVFAASGADVRQVIVGGEVVFTPDDLPGIAAELEQAIGALL